ncbi:hypothetical protein BOTCAL_0404g00010 [Botryotinia calthae]|uniref:Uncharacterized protein n=1 Tax=Botryotinia calthae TaxID=38488 RepID=A0A4Y8CQ16_9HELO|nr:hypothetical protein BOTCAL_0404g00010 [Botryotinia calthae]
MEPHEIYKTTWPAMLKILESDRRISIEEARKSRAEWTVTVKHNPIYANYHMEVKHYWVEKLMWIDLFKGHPFPGIKPKPIAHAATTPVAGTVTDRSSESTGGSKASKAASAAEGRHLNTTPKTYPRLASNSNASTTGQSSAQGKVNKPQVKPQAIPSPSEITETVSNLSSIDLLGRQNNMRDCMQNSEDVKLQQGCGQGSENMAPTPSIPADSHPTAGKIPCPDAAAHRPSIEPFARKREITASALDAVSSSETVVTEQTKHLKLENYPQLDTTKQLRDRPRYGISVPANPTVAEMLMSRKAAVEKRFGVRFEYGLHKDELIFYCELADIESMTYNHAVELCDPAYKFLNEFLRNSYGQLGCIDNYLKSSNWVIKEK